MQKHFSLIPNDWVNLERIINILSSRYLPDYQQDIEGKISTGSEANLYSLVVEDDLTVGGNAGVVGKVIAGSDIELADSATVITRDGSGNLTFKDAVAGLLKLVELGVQIMVEVEQIGVSVGNNSLTGFENKVLIKWVEVKTTSTDWTLKIYSKDDYATKEVGVASGQSGDQRIYLDWPYEDQDSTAELHYNFTSNSGSETHDITVTGIKLR